MNVELKPIGHVQSCFKEKFGVPRQSGMAPSAKGILKLFPDPRMAPALEGLDGFSHIWVLFLFDRAEQSEWKSKVEPPREDGPFLVGTFATRSPHRPNPIGMSVLPLEKVDVNAPGGPEIHVSGLDILDGSPLLDIKPYLPYADSVPCAKAGWAEGGVPRYAVNFSPGALDNLDRQEQGESTRLFIEQVMQWDPRPTSQRRTMPLTDPAHEGREFGFRLGDLEIRWKIQAGGVLVTGILPI